MGTTPDYSEDETCSRGGEIVCSIAEEACLMTGDVVCPMEDYARGREMVKVVPLPRSLLTEILPWWRATT